MKGKLGGVFGALLALGALGSPMDAQAPQRPGPTLDASAAGPMYPTGVPAAYDLQLGELDGATVQQGRGGLGRPVALMGVGAAGLLIGGLVRDEAGAVIMVAGGVLFLYGLYLWATTR